MTTINADVVGLLEIENRPGNEPLANLVSGLNAKLGLGTYDYVTTGAIRVALLYKPAVVSLFGGHFNRQRKRERQHRRRALGSPDFGHLQRSRQRTRRRQYRR